MRKLPTQARSRATVERILTAGVEVLRHDGFADFSTNAVAREAEVSPGTLYQYFADREEILDLVTDRWVEQTSEAVAAALTDQLADPHDADGLVRAVVTALLDTLEADAAMVHLVHVEMPARRTRSRLLALERQLAAVLEAYLAGATPQTARQQAGPSPAVIAWVLVQVTEQLVVRWVVDGHEGVRGPGATRARPTRHELVEIVTALADRSVAASR